MQAFELPFASGLDVWDAQLIMDDWRLAVSTTSAIGEPIDGIRVSAFAEGDIHRQNLEVHLVRSSNVIYASPTLAIMTSGLFTAIARVCC